jgi:hypothetical protein
MDNIKKTELNHLQVDLADEMSHYAQFKALLVLAFIVTLIIVKCATLCIQAKA